MFNQLDIQDRNNGFNELNQSGYKLHHSTETVLNYITNSLIKSMDCNEAVRIAFLDLWAAFDVVDHRTPSPLQQLNASQGIEDTALEWVEFYLSERTQQVFIRYSYRAIKAVTCGIPQSSIYCAQTYAQYTKRLMILFIIYADESQFWKPFDLACPDGVQEAIEHIETSY